MIRPSALRKRLVKRYHNWRDARNYQLKGGHSISLLCDGEECFPAMLKAIDKAEHEILLEMYWFAADSIGQAFADALCEKAREGLRVSIIYDAIGSFGSQELWTRLRKAGAQVYPFHPIAPWASRFKLLSLNRRNHRKILIVDNQRAFCGGINIGTQWMPMRDGGLGWRDDMVRIMGPAVQQLRDVFEHTWRKTTHQPLAPAPDAHELDISKRPQDSTESLSPSHVSAQSQDAEVRVLANHALAGQWRIRQAYLHRIRHARKSIFIANSYFLPDIRVRRALRQASRRGVDVRIMVPGISDVQIVKWASSRLYQSMLNAGIRIFEWQKSMLHSKTAVIDQTWFTTGTYNLDYRSWRINLEVNIEVSDQRVGTSAHQQFIHDLASCEEIISTAWKTRPYYMRLVEWFCFLFRRFL